MHSRLRLISGSSILGLAVVATAAHAGDPGDCNGNGIPDLEEIAAASMFGADSGDLSPFGAGFPQTFVVATSAPALDDVHLVFFATADLGSGNEDVDLYLDGQSYGEILNNADDCSSPPDQDEVTIPASEWNALAADGQVAIALIPSSNVDSGQCDPSSVRVTVAHSILPANDLDRNLVLDVCQSLRMPDGAVPAHGGLTASYYALSSSPSSLPNFGALTPIAIESVPLIDFPATNGAFAGSGLSTRVGAVFTGYVTVPESGFYVFSLESDDGSRLFIGNQLVVDNDGIHAMEEAVGGVGLEAGAHELRVEFFENTGDAGLIARIEGGGLEKQVIPAGLLGRGGRCAGDVSGDGTVDFADLLEILSAWGACATDPCPGDQNGDGVIDFEDLLAVLSSWGPCPADVMIDGVRLSDNLIDAGDVVTIDVDLCSTAALPTGPVLVGVTLSNGGGSSTTSTMVDPGCSTGVQLQIQAPPLEDPGGCGDPVPYEIEVFIQPSGADADPGNNTVTVALEIRPLYWDLVVDVSITPTTLCACFPVNWNVTFTNIGTMTSDPQCYRTGISTNSGSSNWNQTAYACSTCWTDSIQPGDSRTYGHTWSGGCLIWGPQWVKAQIKSSCADCPTGDNFDQAAVQVIGCQ